MMNRRGFLGALVAAPAAAPYIVETVKSEIRRGNVGVFSLRMPKYFGKYASGGTIGNTAGSAGTFNISMQNRTARQFIPQAHPSGRPLRPVQWVRVRGKM